MQLCRVVTSRVERLSCSVDCPARTPRKIARARPIETEYPSASDRLVDLSPDTTKIVSEDSPDPGPEDADMTAPKPRSNNPFSKEFREAGHVAGATLLDMMC